MFGTLIASFATGEIMNSLQRLKKALVAYTVSALCFAVAIIFLMIAGTIWLARRFGAIEATLGVGVAFLAIGIVVLVVHRLTSGVKAKAVNTRRNDDLRKAAIATGIAVLPTLLRGRAGKAALLAPAVGALAYALYRENSGRGRRRRSMADRLPD